MSPAILSAVPARICIARMKSPWLVVLIFIPVVDLIFLPNLAFSERAHERWFPGRPVWPKSGPPEGLSASGLYSAGGWGGWGREDINLPARTVAAAGRTPGRVFG